MIHNIPTIMPLDIRITDWRQFDNIFIRLHPHLTIITGANGAGKSTILTLVAQTFGWTNNFVATPIQTASGLRFSVDTRRMRELFRKDVMPTGMDPATTIGSISFDNGAISEIKAPASGGSAYQLQVIGQGGVAGFHIPSHRTAFGYAQVPMIPTSVRGSEESFQAYYGAVRNRYTNNQFGGASPNFSLKETLLGLAIFGIGNEVIVPDLNAKNRYNGFEELLRKVIPRSIGFKRFAIRPPEIVLITETGDFSMDAVSGGLASIIELAWQLFNFADTHERFTVTFDEPENHLHPELQLHLLPAFLRAFPQAQFIVASHSPIIVSSVRDCNLYALHYEEFPEDSRRSVIASQLDPSDATGTTDEVLSRVLGISHSLPDWVVSEISELTIELSKSPIDTAALHDFRARLATKGLAKFLPEAIANIARDAAS